MNLIKLFETQRVLDDRIIKEKGLEGQDLLPMKILALQVELGELANEWRGFKFWSENQKSNTFYPCLDCGGGGHDFIKNCVSCDGTGKGGNPLLEEYVDCLHFILSIGLTIGSTNPRVEFPITGGRSKEFTTVRFNECLRFANLLLDDDYYDLLFQYFMDLGYMLGFTWGQIEQAYYAKNQINHERQATGY
ncbi:dUTP diphosphatase [Sporosarcina contaminans]|uniref:dUTP diphosphatase n=1 Tax=Sporosarcina contaminans TaxID=633403 RepID=A0ABW3U3I6_9BACL